MLRTHSEIAREERYMNSRFYISKKYSNNYEDTICASSLSLGITSPISLDPAPWDSIVSVSPLARNALCPEPIGTKKVGLRRIKNPPIGTKKVGRQGFDQQRRKERSFGKAYYTASSEEETYFGITKSWSSWNNYSHYFEEQDHMLWLLARSWKDQQNYRDTYHSLSTSSGFGRITLMKYLDNSVARLKLFIQFVNYNFQWTTSEYFNAKHDQFHTSMCALCNEINEHAESLLGCATAVAEQDQQASTEFFKNFKIIKDEVSLFKKKYDEFSGLRVESLSKMLKVDDNMSFTILKLLY